MNTKTIDVGHKFGNWKVLKTGLKKFAGRAALVRCKCGKCSTKVSATRRYNTHPLIGTPEYNAWSGMRRRCRNHDPKIWRYYGGRGIKVCDRWMISFQHFLDDMGTKPSALHSIDRVDVDGNYEPANCRWATRKDQIKNRRKQFNRLFVEKMLVCLKDYYRRCGCHLENSIPSYKKRCISCINYEEIIKYI